MCTSSLGAWWPPRSSSLIPSPPTCWARGALALLPPQLPPLGLWSQWVIHQAVPDAGDTAGLSQRPRAQLTGGGSRASAPRDPPSPAPHRWSSGDASDCRCGRPAWVRPRPGSASPLRAPQHQPATPAHPVGDTADSPGSRPEALWDSLLTRVPPWRFSVRTPVS